MDPEPGSASVDLGVKSITADEIALYDRQIRLWGVQAQEKLRSAKVLLINIKALADEIAKNLVLAGVGSLTIVDHDVVTEQDLASQFLVADENIGQIRGQAVGVQLRKLNPRVDVRVDQEDIRQKAPTFFADFDITIATDLDITTLQSINAACRLSNRKFYATGILGMYGYAFADLITHEFTIERAKSNVPTILGQKETNTRSIVSSNTKKGADGRVIELVSKRETYCPLILANSSPLPEFFISNRRRKLQITPLLTCLRALWEFQKLSADGATLPSHNSTDLALFTHLATEKHKELQLPAETLRAEFLRSFLQNIQSEISPAAAFLGGSLAQDVINVLGAREQPLQNLLLFDGESGVSPIYGLHPFFSATVEAQAQQLTSAIPIDVHVAGKGGPIAGGPVHV